MTAMVLAMQAQKLTLLLRIDAAFGTVPRPEHFTNYLHCEECAEHDGLLRARDRQTLSLADVGNPGWDPLCFITPEGLAYYFPTLARLALAEPDTLYGWYADQFLFHLYWGYRDNVFCHIFYHACQSTVTSSRRLLPESKRIKRLQIRKSITEDNRKDTTKTTPLIMMEYMMIFSLYGWKLIRAPSSNNTRTWIRNIPYVPFETRITTFSIRLGNLICNDRKIKHALIEKAYIFKPQSNGLRFRPIRACACM
ncbi:hypothetical protein [Allochromatium palmeri]|uniref:Uncharacterized protein n=1 Tax=Allochromatium palmeri TaxID=231048 RepID=A0A6N8EJF6_9GAMM|nr:hypothetical protein [Allochromatium palmeri]MTW23069.1 hypothetical protein [Allochromatium palmeri]